DDRRDLLVGIERRELWRELLALAQVHFDDLVGQRAFLQHHRDLAPVRCMRGVEADHAQSTRAPDACTRRRIFSDSAATKRAKSSGVSATMARPRLSMRSATAGVRSALAISAFSFCTTGFGVAAGTAKPYHTLTSNAGSPDSSAVG